MNIIGIGTDIETINRFNLERNKDKKLLEKIFTQSELDYCFAKVLPAQHLAGKFCAKEAIIKAFSPVKKIYFKNIEIISDGSTSPQVVMEGIPHDYTVMLSISHCEDKALAFATLISK